MKNGYHFIDGLLLDCKKCRCGGEPELIVDFVADFLVRCSVCHKSTMAFMDPEEAKMAWNKGKTDGRLDLMIDDIDAALSGELEYILVPDDSSTVKCNEQSCDCDEAFLKYKGREEFISVSGTNGILSVGTFYLNSPERDRVKIAPAKTGAFRYVRAEFDGAREAGALKFLFDDRYLFITASDKWIIVCLSLFDLFGDDPDPEQGYDDSILRWTRKEDEKGQGEGC